MAENGISPLELLSDSLPVIRIDTPSPFDVSKTFDCGQCFRFDLVTDSKHEIEYAGCANGKYVSVAQDGDKVYLYNVTQNEYDRVWKVFLGLDRDYEMINRQILSLSREEALIDAVKRASGIRILGQDGWEAICSFIISQNNNIPRIKKLVAALCEACGDPVDISRMSGHIAETHKTSAGNFYSFPSPEKLLELGVEGLYGMKMGFRAKYLFGAAEKMSRGEIDFDLLRRASLSECVDHLCSVKGIGEKVASCALLFGFGRLEAFPVDVWIGKAMQKYFDEDFAPAKLGQYAGVAQQYLFYYERYLNR